jgi:hypothetical protein
MNTMTRLALLLSISALSIASPALAQGNRGTQRGRPVAEGTADWAITPDLQDAVRRGHKWLAAQQNPGGWWSQDVGFKLNSGYSITKYDAPHVGVTALCLISFLAGGHVPGRGEHGEVLSRGIEYLLNCMQDNGYITDNGTRMYSHAFATLFLAEVYGMTRRADVKRALQRSVNLIVDSQNAEGGWRYKPFQRESDMSITVCQVLALRSARNVGITVPAGTIKAAENYVRRSAVRDGMAGVLNSWSGDILGEGGAFRYQLLQNSRATFPLTAAGVTTMHAAGIYDDEILRNAFDYMDSQLGPFNLAWKGHYFFYYGHYYAVQAYYTAGGDRWRGYFQDMRDRVLLPLQNPDGSWPNSEGPGAAFATAVSTLILQIPYQYLPIFQR